MCLTLIADFQELAQTSGDAAAKEAAAGTAREAGF